LNLRKDQRIEPDLEKNNQTTMQLTLGRVHWG